MGKDSCISKHIYTFQITPLCILFSTKDEMRTGTASSMHLQNEAMDFPMSRQEVRILPAVPVFCTFHYADKYNYIKI